VFHRGPETLRHESPATTPGIEHCCWRWPSRQDMVLLGSPQAAPAVRLPQTAPTSITSSRLHCRPRRADVHARRSAALQPPPMPHPRRRCVQLREGQRARQSEAALAFLLLLLLRLCGGGLAAAEPRRESELQALFRPESAVSAGSESPAPRSSEPAASASSVSSAGCGCDRSPSRPPRRHPCRPLQGISRGQRNDRTVSEQCSSSSHRSFSLPLPICLDGLGGGYACAGEQRADLLNFISLPALLYTCSREC
jgi:hypothetical protein